MPYKLQNATSRRGTSARRPSLPHLLKGVPTLIRQRARVSPEKPLVAMPRVCGLLFRICHSRLSVLRKRTEALLAPNG
jgi:hypothetical protein